MPSPRSLALALLFAACGLGCASDAPPAPGPFAAAPRCSSNERWNPAWAPDSQMYPGRACNACHSDDNAATGGDAPLFAFAGTVFPTAHEPDGCRARASAGAVVEVTGADGRVFRAEVNDWGNFHLDAPQLRTPYTARVLHEGRARVMATRQTDGDCNACHTQDGDVAAPGRVLLP